MADITSIQEALSRFGFELIASLAELQVQNWHGDRYFKAITSQGAYFVRLVKSQRAYRSSPRVLLDEQVLDSQLQSYKHFFNHGLPLVKLHCVTDKNNGWFPLELEGVSYRVVIFDWACGLNLKQVSQKHTEQIGHWLGRSHVIAPISTTQELPYAHSHILHEAWLNDARLLLKAYQNQVHGLSQYFDTCDDHIEHLRSRLTAERIIVHGDFNLPNVFFSEETGLVQSIIDFDQIGVSTAVEDLAWVIKWYAHASSSESVIANITALMAQYLKQYPLTEADFESLPRLLWLCSSLGYNFVLKAEYCIEHSSVDELVGNLNKLLNYYQSRGERLYSLGQAVINQLGSSS